MEPVRDFIIPHIEIHRPGFVNPYTKFEQSTSVAQHGGIAPKFAREFCRPAGVSLRLHGCAPPNLSGGQSTRAMRTGCDPEPLPAEIGLWHGANAIAASKSRKRRREWGGNPTMRLPMREPWDKARYRPRDQDHCKVMSSAYGFGRVCAACFCKVDGDY